jgi:hypothetical protein
MADCAVQAAHLMVSTLTDGDETPLARIHVARANIFWEIIVAVNAPRLDGMCPAICESNTCTQPLELRLTDHGVRCRRVRSAQSGTRVRQGRNNAPLLGKEQEPFALAIESSDREHARGTFSAERRR